MPVLQESAQDSGTPGAIPAPALATGCRNLPEFSARILADSGCRSLAQHPYTGVDFCLTFSCCSARPNTNATAAPDDGLAKRGRQLARLYKMWPQGDVIMLGKQMQAMSDDALLDFREAAVQSISSSSIHTGVSTVTAYRDGQGKWRDANHRFITEEKAKQLIAQATALSQLQTPNPSVSPAPLPRSHSSSSLSISTLGSLASSPTSSTPAPLPEAPVVPQGYEPDVESDAPESPRTPRRQRYRRASTLAAPARPQRPLSESETGDHPKPETSPTVQAPRRGVSPLPSVASVGLRTGLTFVQPPTFSMGPKTPPSLGSAAASVLVGPMSVSDALAQIHSLCGGQFYDDGRPKAEVEYRRNFIFATLGLSDEQVASLWANHLVYDGPAYDWYESLVSTQAGKTAAEKWSTLLPEIEKRWPTPARDTKATARRHRA
ncbi:Retrovirus-related Pol polyprotein from transposon [Ceratobasidium sp. AG-Ba]|nr:Retrovirus-related Pol polyprotein from transposon [Ceratobasidium sp. AG-Ba]